MAVPIIPAARLKSNVGHGYIQVFVTSQRCQPRSTREILFESCIRFSYRKCADVLRYFFFFIFCAFIDCIGICIIPIAVTIIKTIFSYNYVWFIIYELSDNAKLAILFQLFMIQITDIETNITDSIYLIFSPGMSGVVSTSSSDCTISSVSFLYF